MNDQPELQKVAALLEQSAAPFDEACRIVRELISRPQKGGDEPCATTSVDASVRPVSNTPTEIVSTAVASPAPPQSDPERRGAECWCPYEGKITSNPDCPIHGIAPGHNPDKLTREQVGEGWRLLEEDELVCTGNSVSVIDSWSHEKWYAHSCGCNKEWTYRTRLPRAELRAARGLPQEPTPANPCRDEAGTWADEEAASDIQKTLMRHGLSFETRQYINQLIVRIQDAAIARERHRQAPDEATIRDAQRLEGMLREGHLYSKDSRGLVDKPLRSRMEIDGFLAGVRAAPGPKPEGRES